MTEAHIILMLVLITNLGGIIGFGVLVFVGCITYLESKTSLEQDRHKWTPKDSQQLLIFSCAVLLNLVSLIVVWGLYVPH